MNIGLAGIDSTTIFIGEVPLTIFIPAVDVVVGMSLVASS